MKYIYELHKTMLDKKLILVYEGEFTQDIVKSVLSMAERNMDSFGEASGVKRKVFNVMVECLQNICKHAVRMDEDGNVRNNAIFIIGKNEDQYFITSGNAMHTHEVDSMIRRLAQINELDKDGLKKLYRNRLTEIDKLSPQGGAGLGFIDMAKKSGNKLSYHFEQFDDTHSFFSLKTVINRKK